MMSYASNEATSRPRQIILGCDGTNNTLTGGLHDTNVLKLIAQLGPESAERILYYDPGVGSHDQVPALGLWNHVRRKLERLAGLANGRGIYENIAEAYLFLVDHYRAGDQIYIFGFSRGAFTARSVAGMVNLFGIIRPDSKSLMLTLVRLYFSASSDNAAGLGLWQRYIMWRNARRAAHKQEVTATIGSWAPGTHAEQIARYLTIKAEGSSREAVANQVRRSFTSADGAEAPIHFVGVWDTVESVGIPFLKRTITSAGTTREKSRLRHIRHALSLDEHRFTFAPRLYWNDDYNDAPHDPASHRSLRQTWFRGVHSDIGGGYAIEEAGLSDQAYQWMLNEAIGCGLQVAAPRAASMQQPKPFIVHDACHKTPWWGVAGLTVRSNVTHRANGVDQTVPVTTAGVANDAHARLYPVWSAARVAWWKIVLVLLVIAGLFAWYGWTASAAFADTGAPGLVTRILRGASALESWKISYFPAAYRQALPLAHTVLVIPPAVQATLIDFGLIVAYSYVLGLCATWAFHAMAGRRNPRAPVSWRFSLGLAPMVMVLADVAENCLSLLTLWCIAHQLEVLSYLTGAAMAIATGLKWVALVGAGALIACGIVAQVRATATRPERRRHRTKHVFRH